MDQINLILNAIEENTDAIKVILFGSYAFGKQGEESDLDVAVIQKSTPKLGQKANVFLSLAKRNYDWSKEPDLHIFSEEEYQRKLKEKDLFVREISKGKVIYDAKA